MHPEDRKSIKIQIENRYYVDGEMCYYQIYVDQEDLDTWANEYEWYVEFQELTSVDAVLSTGTELRTVTNSTKVGLGQSFEFNATNNQVYISFTGNKAKRKHPDPSFVVRVALVTTPITAEDKAASGEELIESLDDDRPNVEIQAEEVEGKFLLPGMGIVLFLIAAVGLITYFVSRAGKKTIAKYSPNNKKTDAALKG